MVLFSAFAATAQAETVFQKDGAITSGQNRMILREGGVIQITDCQGSQYSIFLSIPFKNDKTWRSAGNLQDKKLDVNPSAKSVTLRGKAIHPAGNLPTVEVEWGYQLLDQGRIRCTLLFKNPDPKVALKDIFNGMSVYFSLHRKYLVGHQLMIDDQEVAIQDVPPYDASKQLKPAGKITRLVCFSDEPSQRIEVYPISYDVVGVADRHIKTSTLPSSIELPMHAKKDDGRVEFDLVLPQTINISTSADTYAGMDFWASNKMHMPMYGNCKNMVQNSGFEGRFQYWQWNTLGIARETPRSDQQYAIVDDPTAPDGSRCLALRGESENAYAGVGTYAIPVEPGETYTLSFYAKGEKNGQIMQYGTVTAVWPIFPANGDVTLTTEWKRFTKTFKAPNRTVSIAFSHQRDKQEGWVYVDAVQLEKSETAGEYVRKSAEAFIASDVRGNYWAPNQKTNPRLDVYGKPSAKGQIKITQEDFFGRIVDRSTVDYQLNASGRFELPLPWAQELDSGLYVYQLDIKTDDGFATREFDRIAVLSPLNNTHKHKNLFAMGIHDGRIGDWKRRYDFYRQIGIGSGITFDPAPHAFYDVLRDNHILYFASIFDGGEGFKGIFDQKKTCSLTPEQLAKVEELSYQKALANRKIQYWKLNNEPPSQPYMDNPKEMDAMVNVLRAARKGILRANPKAIILSSDPANMYPNGGIQFLDRLWESASKDNQSVLFDIAAIHPYRQRPEEPDRDEHTNTFLKMLDRHGFKGDVWFTEGIYHCNYIVPLLELNSHAGCSSDHYRGGDLSYHLGWGEKIAAAYTARSWLVSLKYADRVKMDIDWCFQPYSNCDVDLKPRAVAYAANTLGNILGNADYQTELSLGSEIRCYVFKDEKNRPVAAIWHYGNEVDMGRTTAPTLNIRELLEAIPALRRSDFMQKNEPATATIQLSSFPQFLIGEPDSLARFTENLGKAFSESGGDLFPYLSLRSANEIELVLANELGRPFNGQVQVFQGETLLKQADITIAAKGQWRFVHAQAMGPNQINESCLTVKTTPQGQKQTKSFEVNGAWMRWPKRRDPVMIDGDLADWTHAFQCPIINQKEYVLSAADSRRQQYPQPPKWNGPDDLSATFHAMWDEQYLYLACKVRDDTHRAGPNAPSAWQGDGLQIYFDGWADARQRKTNGYDVNDQSFMVWPNEPANQLTLYRDQAPEQQLAFLKTGIVTNAKSALKRTRDGYLIYEMAIPAREVEPVILKAASKFGFAAIVNDLDEDYRKRILTMTPAGTEPFCCPHLYPIVLLEP